VHEVDDAPPAVDVLRGVQTRAAERDASLGRHARHLGEHEAGAAEGAGAEVDEMEIVRYAVHGAIHVHRRHDHAVR
jgi:hypothetical protein